MLSNVKIKEYISNLKFGEEKFFLKLKNDNRILVDITTVLRNSM